MVDAKTWINENYPKNGASKDPSNLGKKRAEITELDISLEGLFNKGMLAKNEYLVGTLDDASLSGFDSLRKLNMSGHQITHGIVGEAPMMEEIDYSYNYRGKDKGSWGGDGKATEAFPKLRKLNLSQTTIKGVYLLEAPELTHLDVSNNVLEGLDLTNNKKLVELKCSNNNPKIFAFTPDPSNLSEKSPYFPNLISVDCLGIKFPVDATTTTTSTPPIPLTPLTPSPSTPSNTGGTVSSPTPINNNIIIAITIPLGVFSLIIIIAIFYYRRKRKEKNTPDHSSQVLDTEQNNSNANSEQSSTLLILPQKHEANN